MMVVRAWQSDRDCQALPFWHEKIARTACTIGPDGNGNMSGVIRARHTGK